MNIYLLKNRKNLYFTKNNSYCPRSVTNAASWDIFRVS